MGAQEQRVEQQERGGGGQRRQHAGAEAVPGVRGLGLGVEDVVQERQLQLGHLVQLLLAVQLRFLAAGAAQKQTR
uniref:Uncharacterized protein n=1 Tax=Zea mays TaxID=4577 RepID=B6U6E5_MAIZE|nr:hypothetical protein [Zea mays]